MSVGVKDVVSSVNERIFEICEPRLRCTPEHSLPLETRDKDDTDTQYNGKVN